MKTITGLLKVLRTNGGTFPIQRSGECPVCGTHYKKKAMAMACSKFCYGRIKSAREYLRKEQDDMRPIPDLAPMNISRNGLNPRQCAVCRKDLKPNCFSNFCSAECRYLAQKKAV